MKKSNTKIYLLAAALTLAACVKEEPTSLPGTGSEVVDGVKLALQVENPSDSTETAPDGAKVTTDGSNTYWYYDDVTVNGVVYSVGGNQQSQSVTVTRSHGEYYVASVGNVTQNSPNYASSYQSFNVTYPNTYTYSLQGGRQWLYNLPMIAIAGSSASALNFKQLTSLVAVQCSNTTRVPMKMTSIVLEGTRELCGEASASMTYNGTPAIGSTTISIPDAWKKVTLNFNGFESTSVTLQPGESRTFYIPVRPNAFSQWMDVTVNVKYNDPTPNGVLRVVNQDLFDERIEKTAQFTGWISSLTLERAKRHSIYLNLRHEKMPDLVDPYFSVGSNSKVYFSYGNLFCISSSNSSNTAPYLGWCLAEVGDPVNALGTTYPSYDADTRGSNSNWYYNLGTHLFLSWGTSGYNSGAAVYNPVMKQTDQSGDYYTSIAPNSYTDWGVYSHIGYNWYNPSYTAIKSLPRNPSSVPGWRTLTSDQWEYLLTERANADAKRGYGKVNGVPGLILLPDNFTMPTFTGASTYHSTFHSCNNTSASALSYSNNTYTTAEWQQMKARGAVFLPAITKYRRGTGWNSTYIPSEGAGMYWSSTVFNQEKGCAMRFDPSKGTVANKWDQGICISTNGRHSTSESGMGDSKAVYLKYGIYVRLVCNIQ